MQCHFPVLRIHNCVSGGFRTPVLIHHTETLLLPLVKPLYYLNPTPSQDLTPLPRIGMANHLFKILIRVKAHCNERRRVAQLQQLWVGTVPLLLLLLLLLPLNTVCIWPWICKQNWCNNTGRSLFSAMISANNSRTHHPPCVTSDANQNLTSQALGKCTHFTQVCYPMRVKYELIYRSMAANQRGQQLTVAIWCGWMREDATENGKGNRIFNWRTRVRWNRTPCFRGLFPRKYNFLQKKIFHDPRASNQRTAQLVKPVPLVIANRYPIPFLI